MSHFVIVYKTSYSWDNELRVRLTIGTANGSQLTKSDFWRATEGRRSPTFVASKPGVIGSERHVRTKPPLQFVPRSGPASSSRESRFRPKASRGSPRCRHRACPESPLSTCAGRWLASRGLCICASLEVGNDELPRRKLLRRKTSACGTAATVGSIAHCLVALGIPSAVFS
jgi:hypothetical protein